uniref:Candidate secreted effector n=1 Tax=Meloidogyne incognita TaxID=6306 RepID=A0A914MTF0_MELIC
MHFGFITTIYFIFLQIFDSSTKLGEIALERNASKLRLGHFFKIFWGLLIHIGVKSHFGTLLSFLYMLFLHFFLISF